MNAATFKPIYPDSFVQEALQYKELAPIGGGSGFSGVITDSRQVSSGSLFIAIRGDRFDGHDFIVEAFAKGARAAVCARGREPASLTPVQRAALLLVDSTDRALTLLGHAWRMRYPIPVLAIAGSVGKTTTKELVTALLRGKHAHVLKTTGSQNGFLGIPITLLEMRPEHSIAVIEIGIDEIGAMEQHLKTVQPSAALLTPIGPEHLERLIDVTTVAREETLALQATAKAGGKIALNLDDEWIFAVYPEILNFWKDRGSPERELVPFTLAGREVDSEVEVLRGTLSADQSSLELSGLGYDGLSLQLPLLGKHNALNLLAAVGLAATEGLTAQEVTRGLEHFEAASGRSEINKARAGNTVICDFYNAQPVSVRAGLELLTQLAQGRRRFACLADMLELGALEEKLHRGLAESIATLKIEQVLLFGERMKWLVSELDHLRVAGRLSTHFMHFETKQALIEHLKAEARAADVILIKGSRGMRMEDVWKAIS